MIKVFLVTSRESTEARGTESLILEEKAAQIKVENASSNTLLVSARVGLSRDLLGNTRFQMRTLVVLQKNESVTFPFTLDVEDGDQPVTVVAHELRESLYSTIPDISRLPNGSRFDVERLHGFLQRVAGQEFQVKVAEPAIA